jgi:esterase/lipase
MKGIIIRSNFKIIIRENNSKVTLDAGFYHNIYDKGKKLPLIIFLHGWNNNRSELDYLIGPLIEKDFKILNYSYRGHGNSEGERSPHKIFTDINHVINFAIKKIPNIDVKNIILIGISLGAAITLTEGYRNKNIKYLIALNPYFNAKETYNNKSIFMRLYTFLTKMKFKDEDNKFLSPKFFLNPEKNNSSRISLLMTKKDRYINFEQKQKLLDFLKLHPNNVFIFEKGSHTFKGVKNKVISLIINWLEGIIL